MKQLNCLLIYTALLIFVLFLKNTEGFLEQCDDNRRNHCTTTRQYDEPRLRNPSLRLFREKEFNPRDSRRINQERDTQIQSRKWRIDNQSQREIRLINHGLDIHRHIRRLSETLRQLVFADLSWGAKINDVTRRDRTRIQAIERGNRNHHNVHDPTYTLVSSDRRFFRNNDRLNDIEKLRTMTSNNNRMPSYIDREFSRRLLRRVNSDPQRTRRNVRIDSRHHRNGRQIQLMGRSHQILHSRKDMRDTDEFVISPIRDSGRFRIVHNNGHHGEERQLSNNSRRNILGNKYRILIKTLDGRQFQNLDSKTRLDRRETIRELYRAIPNFNNQRRQLDGHHESKNDINHRQLDSNSRRDRFVESSYKQTPNNDRRLSFNDDKRLSFKRTRFSTNDKSIRNILSKKTNDALREQTRAEIYINSMSQRFQRLDNPKNLRQTRSGGNDFRNKQDSSRYNNTQYRTDQNKVDTRRNIFNQSSLLFLTVKSCVIAVFLIQIASSISNSKGLRFSNIFNRSNKQKVL